MICLIQLPRSPYSMSQTWPRRKFIDLIGPGLVTGAADDDPSGIATYSQAGAQFGFAMLWVMLFSFPLMAAIQEICGRLGRITDWVWPRTWRNATPRSWS